MFPHNIFFEVTRIRSDMQNIIWCNTKIGLTRFIRDENHYLKSINISVTELMKTDGFSVIIICYVNFFNLYIKTHGVSNK